MNISLRQLRYFEELARQKHFGRAAEACRISQPALSVQIKELEQVLGATLVERRSGKVALTDMGEAVLVRAKGILKAVEELGDFSRAAHDSFAGRLRMGLIPTAAPYMLPQMMARLKESYPQLELHVREATTRKLIEELKSGRLDVAVVALPISEDSLTEVALFEDPFVLVRPLSERKKPAPTPEQLRRMNLLLLEEGHCFREQALAFCKMPSPAGGDALEAASLATLVQMVAAGLGVTLIPRMAAQVELRRVEVDAIRLPEPQPVRTMGLVWRKGSPLAGRLGELAEILREE